MRLIFAEADGFPGFIVDSYDGHLVLQVHHPGIARLLGNLVDLLHRLVQPKSITLRNDSDVRRLEGLPLEVEVLSGDLPERVVIQEGPLQFLVDVRHGQKTGMFLDQRENRQATAAWAGGDVLDCFSYQGGFALHAARSARPWSRRSRPPLPCGWPRTMPGSTSWIISSGSRLIALTFSRRR